MAATFVESITSSMRGSAVRCGVNDRSLQGKRLQIADALQFTVEMEREIASQSKWLDAVNLAGAVAWSAIMVTDIIQNTVKVAPKGGAQVVMKVLDRAKAEAGKNKFTGARYAAEIKNIDVARKVLRASLPPGSKDLADLFADMLADSLGLIGFIETGNESRASLNQSIKISGANIAKMRTLLAKIDAQIADSALNDDGSPDPSPRIGPLSSPPKVDFATRPMP